MPPIAWLVVSLLAFGAAYLVGWPAWEAYRSRDQRDENAERYLAWRGRASRGPRPSVREGMTGEERRRIYAGVALAIGGALALFIFFATT